MATTAGVFALLAPAGDGRCRRSVFVGADLLEPRVVSLGSLGAMVALPPLTAWLGGVAAGRRSRACVAATLVVVPASHQHPPRLARAPNGGWGRGV